MSLVDSRGIDDNDQVVRVDTPRIHWGRPNYWWGFGTRAI